MSSTLQILESIRDDLWHERNAFLAPPFGEAEKYARWVDEAEKKIDAINRAICAIQQDEVAHG